MLRENLFLAAQSFMGLSCFISGACHRRIGCYFAAMKQLSLTLCTLVAACVSLFAGSPQGAERIVKEQRLAELEWQQQLLSAITPEQKKKIYEARPNNAVYGQRMVREIGNSLTSAWTMPYAVWLLNFHPELSAGEVSNLIAFVDGSHRKSPYLGEFCIALAAAGESSPEAASKMKLTQKKIKFIESVVHSELSKVVRGQACLALSAQLAKMGDSPEINKRRLDLIRKVIINAADTKIGEMTVADLAKEEIYRMTKLSKGATAPELVGTDSSGRQMRLSDSRGKVVVLVFWSSWEQSLEVLEYLKKLETTFQGQQVDIVGVNRDSLKNLREIEMAQMAVGKNFTDAAGKLFNIYRVVQSPACYVLDEKGVIQYNGQLGSFVDFTVTALLAEK